MQPVSQNRQIVGHFESVRDFQRYFQEHDELRLSPGQCLEIYHVPDITSEENDSQMPQQEVQMRILSILNRMLLPLAKTITIEFVPSMPDDGSGKRGNLSYHMKDPFSLSYSRGMSLQAKKDAIYTRLTDLFQAMISSSIETVQFDPGQKLIVMGAEPEWKQESGVEGIIGQLLETSTPAGFKVRYQFNKGEGNNCAVSRGETEYGSYGRQKSITIRAAQGATLSLKENRKYSFSTEGFRRRMQVKEELRLPPGKTLCISDNAILEWRAEYENSPYLADIAGNFGQFVFNQILLPLGKTLVITGQGSTGYDLKWGDDFLNISSQDGVILIAGYGRLVASLHRLERVIIAHHLSCIKLQPEQDLIIYGLSEETRMQLDEWVTSTNLSSTKNGLEQFFLPYNPVGFTWSLEFQGQGLYKAAVSLPGERNAALFLRSEGLLKMSLERASGSWLVINLLNNSSPELLEGIKEMDSDAFIYLLFKAIFYYCCDDFRHFRTDELPAFFQEETRRRLQEVLKDNQFTDSLRSVLKDPKVNAQLSDILKMTPSQFKDLDYSLLETPVRDLLTKIMELVYKELKGSYFLTECVKQVHIGLENGTLQTFLRPPPPVEPLFPPPVTAALPSSSISDPPAASGVAAEEATTDLVIAEESDTADERHEAVRKASQEPNKTPTMGFAAHCLSFMEFLAQGIWNSLGWLFRKMGY